MIAQCHQEREDACASHGIYDTLSFLHPLYPVKINEKNLSLSHSGRETFFLSHPLFGPHNCTLKTNEATQLIGLSPRSSFILAPRQSTLALSLHLTFLPIARERGAWAPEVGNSMGIKYLTFFYHFMYSKCHISLT